MRSSKSTIKKEYYDDVEVESFTESEPFREYVKLIESVLSDTPKTIGDIHRALGDKVQRIYTFDALEWSENIQEIRGYLNKYVLIVPKKVETKPTFGSNNADIFAKGKRTGEYPRNSSIYGARAVYD